MGKVISIVYRESDAAQRSYSLLERLRAGTLLFASEPLKYRELYSAKQIFWNAVHVVFDNRFLKAEFTKPNHPPPNRTPPSYDPELAVRKMLDYYNSERAKDNSPLNKFTTAGYWNPFAWLEALALFWTNLATDRYNPLTDGFVSSTLSYFHIILAATAHAVAKTINLVFTPLALILVTSAAIALGGTLGVKLCFGLGILFALGSFAYHSYQYWKLIKDSGYEPTTREVIWAGLKHVVQALVLGITQPLIRLFERANDLRKTHPWMFGAAVLFTVLAVCAIGVFPYVGAPAIMGFKLGTILYNALTPALTVMSNYFTLTGLESRIFQTTVTLVATLGVVDLITRGCKEVSGWIDSWRANRANIEQGYTQPITRQEVSLIKKGPHVNSSPTNPHQTYFFQYELAPKRQNSNPNVIHARIKYK